MDDLKVAKGFVNKARSSVDRGIPFDLSFTSYKNLMLAKRCKYTGITLTTPNPATTTSRATDRTIDRIDNSLGYVKGNVVAVCHSANQLKSIWENPNSFITAKVTKRMIRVVHKLEERG